MRSLLDNGLFLRWVLEPTPELDAFWMQEIAESEELKNSIYDLKESIAKLKIEEPALSADDRNLIWENIRQAAETAKDAKKNHRITGRRMAVAAVFIGMLAGVYIYSNSNRQPGIDYMSMIDEVTPSGNISLVLAGNEVVDIRKDTSNVVYDPAGKVKINGETIEGTGNEKPATLNQLIVPYGKTTSLTLGDGTKIWVNSGSRLVYPSVFGKDRREIFLTGEIYLDVAGKDHCPFIVKTGYLDISVKGTQFNVSAYPDEEIHSVVLVSGTVSVKGKALDGTYNIYPNQMLSYETGSDNAGVSDVDVNSYISWTHGYLMLQGERIDRVLQKLEKYFNVSFTCRGSGFDKIYVSGKLDLTGSLESTLNYISVATSISYTINNDSIEIINSQI
ncbi:MAG: FecR family protein [Tannerella sp.]|jgi:ferric-dicitrate binding protein FerR (iron transport regulator)|nr:FecR family protein [Tannerella sp.]